VSKSAISFKLQYQFVLIVDTQEKGSDTLIVMNEYILHIRYLLYIFSKSDEKVTGGFCPMEKSLDFYLIVSLCANGNS
jgi:hypothetical protein